MFCLCRPQVTEHEDDRNFNPLETPQERIIKMVLLGPAASSKTTIIKQFKKISDSLDESDIINQTAHIKHCVLYNMKTLCQQSLMLEQQCLELVSPFSVHTGNEHLRDEFLSMDDETQSLTPQMGLKIHTLWHDPGIRSTLRQRHRFQMDPNTAHFLNKVNTIAQTDYVPDFDDYVRIYHKSSGYCMCKCMKYIQNFGEYLFEVVDVGGAQLERNKWCNNHLLADMDFDAVLYTVPISDYDLTMCEDNKTNRLVDALCLFEETMIKTDFVNDKALFLLFTKYDVYLEKIKDVPITCCFDDFPDNRVDPYDAGKVIRFVAGKFLNVFSENNVGLKGPLKILRSTA
eukprot:251686_1